MIILPYTNVSKDTYKFRLTGGFSFNDLNVNKTEKWHFIN